MNVTEMKPNQVYVLTDDVINPKPDRRQTRDWRALPTIPKGTRFWVRSNVDHSQYPELCGLPWNHQSVFVGSKASAPLVDAVLPHLVVADDSDAFIYRMQQQYQVSDERVLRRLLDSGVLSRETYESVAKELDEEYRLDEALPR